MTGMTGGKGRRYGAAAVALAALLTLGACGGDDEDAGIASAGGEVVGTGSETSGAPDDNGVAFAGCMREQGIDVPDPVGEDGLAEAFQSVQGDYDRETMRAAMEECSDLRPEDGGPLGNGMLAGQGEAMDEETKLALAECLREQGLDVSDDFFGQGPHEDIDRGEMRAAMGQCEDVLQ